MIRLYDTLERNSFYIEARIAGFNPPKRTLSSKVTIEAAYKKQKAKKEAERKKREAEAEEGFEVDASEEMTEADCRELWRILQGLEREFQEMKSIADDWFTVHGKGNGCFAALAMMALIPVGAIYGICQML